MKSCRAFLVALGFAACSQQTSPEPDPLPGGDGLRLVEVASGLASPVYLTSPIGDDRLFVVEQPGRIRIIEDGRLSPTPFLDITDRVVAGGERGLLSVAFHPRYAENGYLFVNYTGAGGATRIERYSVTADRSRADPASAYPILSVPQPFANHNGGQVNFGPDGMLYIGMGDGGSGGDPQGNGQNPTTLLGAMLRIDVDGGDPYGIPAGNPYAGTSAGRGEIWAIGLRNPWRFSFDSASGLLYIADVGQNRREEINARPATEAGLNYGWNSMEGSQCFSGSGCEQAGLVLPILDYPNPSGGCSVTGGYVYRGAAMPTLQGHYFYGDYCGGRVHSFRLTPGGEVLDRREWPLGSLGSISSFGQDAAGELYVVVHHGRVFRLGPD